MDGFRGIYAIMATPFHPDGSIDEASLRTLAKFQADAGVDGVTILGILGEAHKLTEAERRRVIEICMAEIGSRVKVIVGTSAAATDLAIAYTKEAKALGAHGSMVAPPTNSKSLEAVREYYRRVHDAVDLPMVVQDEPTFSNVIMPAAFLASVCQALPRARTIKLEEWPSPLKTEQVLKQIDPKATSVLGGMGGVYFYEELNRGAAGTMTGFAFPEILVEIQKRFTSDDRAGAREIFYKYAPLIRYEGQQGIGLALRKEILKRRGLIAHNGLRHPAMGLDPSSNDEITELLDWSGLTPILTRVVSAAEMMAPPGRAAAKR